METGETLKDRVRALSDAIVSEAVAASDYTPIFGSFCDRLMNAGVPVFRVHIATSTLHPLAEAVTLTWRRGDGVEFRLHEHGSSQQDDWQLSPLKAMLDAKALSARFRDADLEEAATLYPLIADLIDEGLTDYFALAMMFTETETAFEDEDGLIASFSTDAPNGFSPEHIEAIQGLMPKFCLVSKLANRETVFANVLEAYLGPDAGAHVRKGQIALGSGDIIDAVIWFCDLRGSVTLAERLGHEGFIDLLNDYFAALAGAVVDNGGQVLRFIGDAALAIFPIGSAGMTEAEAKARALQAARDAIGRAAKTNEDRRTQGKEPFEFGIALHIGRILYGNIGIPSRVEFSVIGPAANQAARIEGLCKSIGEVVLVSETFQEGFGQGWRDLGTHEIKGSRQIRLFAPAV